MDRPLLRVDLSAKATDFELLAVEPGLPMVDKWNATGSLLGNWLGRFAAEPVWEGELLTFYLRDDQGCRVADAKCQPAANTELEGRLKGELNELQNRLQQAVPQSAGAHTMHRFVSRGLIPGPQDAGFARLNCQFFKYREVDGVWRLVWCYGYQPAQRESVRPVICGNPDCRHLALTEGTPDAKCLRCQKPLPPPNGPPPRYGKRIAVLLLLLLLAAGGVYAYTRPSAVLTGRVVCAADQRPVAGAEIALDGAALNARSDAQGEFRIGGVRGGAAKVVVSAPGFQQESLQADLVAWAETSIEVQLKGAGRLGGKVVHLLGKETLPVNKAQVAVEGNPQVKAECDGRGEFRLGGLPPGPLVLRVSAPGFRSVQAPGAASVDGEPLRVVLAADGTVAGKVVYAIDPSLPVAGAEVRIEAIEQPKTGTDKDGAFILAGVPPIRVNVQASAKGFRTHRVAAEPGASSVRIPLVGDAVLTGEVVRGDTSRPVANAEVRLTGTPFAARTDEQGRFRLEGACSGPAQIAATAPGLAGSLSKDLAADGQTSVRIVLAGSATLSGRVTSAADKRPIAEATVAVAQTQLKATTDAQGQFTLAGIPPSTVVLNVAAKDHLPKEIKRELADGQQQLDDVVLTPAAELSGMVVSALDKAPIEGAEITLTGAPEKLRTGRDGAFTVSGVPAGPATIDVAAPGFRAQRLQHTLAPGQQKLAEVALAGAIPVAGVTLEADNRQRAVPNATLEVRLAGTQRAIASAANGGFEVGELPPCLVEVTARAAGYRDTQVQKRVLPKDAWIEVPLPRLIAVKGAVVDGIDKQRAVPNAKLEVIAAGDRRTLSAEANGAFTLGEIPVGPVYVTARAEGYRETRVTKAVSANDAWIEVPMSRLLTARGIVYDAATRQPVAGASVRVSVEGVEQRVASGADGGFSVAVPAGEADVHATANGFCEASLSKRLTPEDAVLQVPMARGTTVRGAVVNAVNNKAVPGATVVLEIKDARRTTSTDPQGQFELSEMPAGTGLVDVSAPGYESLRLACQSGGAGSLRVLLSPQIPPGMVRIVLAWGSAPRDLDAHLYGPLPGGSRFHVSFDKPAAAGATLDVDAKQGLGPETITMKAGAGAYQYFVAHNDSLGTSDGQGLARSGAQVRVYYKKEDGALFNELYAIPANPAGPVWHVFDVEVDQAGKIAVVPKNAWYKDVAAQ